MQIYRLISPVWISKNMVRFFFCRGSSRNLNFTYPGGAFALSGFSFPIRCRGMVPLSVAGLRFVYRGRERLFVSQCRFMRAAVFWLSVGLSDALSCLVSVWSDIHMTGCRGGLCFSCSIIGRSRKNIRGADSPDVFSAPLDTFWGDSVTLSRLSLTLYSCSDTLSCYSLTVPRPSAYKAHGIICHCRVGGSGVFSGKL